MPYMQLKAAMGNREREGARFSWGFALLSPQFNRLPAQRFEQSTLSNLQQNPRLLLFRQFAPSTILCVPLGHQTIGLPLLIPHLSAQWHCQLLLTSSVGFNYCWLPSWVLSMSTYSYMTRRRWIYAQVRSSSLWWPEPALISLARRGFGGNRWSM